MLAFLLFSVVFSVVYYMHFHLAVVTWNRLKGNTSSELDNSYVRIEDYFGQSFRAKLKEWLQLPKHSSSSERLGVIDKGGERIYISKNASYPSNHVESAILVVEGEFLCAAYCTFEKELFVRRDCVVGPSSELQALAVDGAAKLGPGTRVQRWVDSIGPLEIQGDCHINSRATSRTSIRVGPGSRAKSLFAPEVATHGRRKNVSVPKVGVVTMAEFPGSPEEAAVEGFDPSRMISIGGNCCRYEGNLILKRAVHLTRPLIVRGDFECSGESFIEADIKASGSILIGDSSIVKANLVALGDIVLNPEVVFQGILHSGGKIRLRHGVRGLREAIPVAAYAKGPIEVESNCVINGKLSSAKYVEAVLTPIDWFELQKSRTQTETGGTPQIERQ
jgi:predicted acyltransferase (DUF342 family)